jgi:hypothetical protein
MTLVKTRPVTPMMVSNRPKTMVALGVLGVPKVGNGAENDVAVDRGTAGIAKLG